MKRIAITGAKGTIGTMLRKGLTKYEIIPIDLPEVDARDYRKLLGVSKGCSAVIHLAWDAKAENFRSGGLNPDNILMASNVYRAALEAKVPKVIMASSVHADNFYGWKGPGLLSPDRIPVPDNPYGASKVFMEALGRYYASKGLEVICIRFGGVNPSDSQKANERDYERIWLSYRDCCSLVSACLDAPKIPNNFLIVYGISNNKGKVHDNSNPVGWRPADGSK
ncbi:NAD(P)-dependent oxidoreductase [Candidatus Woesearchaeota archaeon]|nr:NAD(P)-dependent oxidoreductase [Candidatus Woesearchaeota archaeon]